MKSRYALLSLLICGATAQALEVDPYLAWMQRIEDSTPAINAYLNESARNAVELANENPRKFDSCSAVTIAIFRRMHKAVLLSRPLVRHINRNPDIDKYGRPHFAEVSGSMYRYVPQLYFSSLADSINVDGIYMSSDKLGHVFGFGRRYYKKYLDAIDDGLGTEAALLKAIEYGVRHEKGIVGKVIDGIYSYADLEANYQGMQLARSFCEGNEPNLAGSPGAWEWHHDADISGFVLPTFDEGYLPNNFIKVYRPMIRKRLKRYCHIRNLPFVADRLDDYKARDRITLSRTFITDNLTGKEFKLPCEI
jgi:hypothetical protein